MRKILTVITTAFVPYGGLTTVIMNYYRAMDKSGLQIDIASTNDAPHVLVDELAENSSRYFCLGDRKRHIATYRRNLWNLLRLEHYDVIHVNGNSATMCIELIIAKKCGVKTRIAHGHTEQSSYKVVAILQRILTPYLIRLCTHRIAVSDKAGKWLYGCDFTVMNNAIDVGKYKFDKAMRKEYRQQLEIGNRTLIGHVGKLYEVKNHTFLLKVFAEVKRRKSDVMLLLVGGGELEADLRMKCETLGIRNDVIFTGMVANPQDYLQAMDMFVFPSLYEGSPLALVEAQANGLPCLVSDAITMDVKFADNVIYKSLKDGVDSWSNVILSIMDRGCERNPKASEDVREHGYDIKYEAEKLRKIYQIEEKEV